MLRSGNQSEVERLRREVLEKEAKIKELEALVEALNSVGEPLADVIGNQNALLKHGPEASPYQNPRIAVAAVVLRSNPHTKGMEMLLVQRWVYPFKGAWALPGDFIGHDDPKKEVIRILEQTTNLTGTAHFLTILGSRDRDPRDHVVTFVFLVHLFQDCLMASDEFNVVMDQDGSLSAELVKRAPIDKRSTPSWAWWYDVSQLPNWLTVDERKNLEKSNPDVKKYAPVAMAFDHANVFPLVREWITKYGESECAVVDPNLVPRQPLNKRNSALTGDIIVIKRKRNRKFEIALITRGINPFFGKFALPGGFIQYREDPAEGAIRELWEETNLLSDTTKVHLLEYKGSRERDPRQHTVTCVYVVKANQESLEHLKPDDDADNAAWFDLDEVFSWPEIEGRGIEMDPMKVPLHERRLAFDHAVILQDFKKWWNSEGRSNEWYVDEGRT